jgi:hypothetical protein
LGYVGWPEKSLDGEKGMLWLAGLVGWVGKIWNKFRKLLDFPGQYENRRHGNPTVSRSVPVTPYPVFILFIVFPE